MRKGLIIFACFWIMADLFVLIGMHNANRTFFGYVTLVCLGPPLVFVSFLELIPHFGLFLLLLITCIVVLPLSILMQISRGFLPLIVLVGVIIRNNNNNNGEGSKQSSKNHVE